MNDPHKGSIKKTPLGRGVAAIGQIGAYVAGSIIGYTVRGRPLIPTMSG
jgi:hypothetical protein